MSDLQCPARVYLVAPGADLSGLHGERVVRVYADSEHEEYGGRAAAVLGVPLAVEGTDDLDGLADLHSGEAIVVVRDVSGPGVTAMERDMSGWQRVD